MLRIQTNLHPGFIALFFTALIAGHGGARAQTVSDVSFHAGGFLELICLSPVTFNVSQAALASIFTGGTGDDAITTAATTGNALGSSANLVATLTGLDTSMNADPSALYGTFVGCAVRGSGQGSGVDVTAALTATPHLNGPGVGQILVDQVLVRQNGTGNAFTTSFTIPESQISFGSYTYIDTQIEFDFSFADRAGTYSSSPGGSYTITVTAP